VLSHVNCSCCFRIFGRENSMKIGMNHPGGGGGVRLVGDGGTIFCNPDGGTTLEKKWNRDTDPLI